MPATANFKFKDSGLVHMFNSLENASSKCEMCNEHEPAFLWSKQRNQFLVRRDVPVCRTCAGLIILVGREEWRNS